MPEIKRKRPRRDSLKINEQEIVSRVLDFYERDLEDMSADREARLQRYAKYRQWTEGKDWPYPDSSDVPLPDMAEKSLRVQDTLAFTRGASLR